MMSGWPRRSTSADGPSRGPTGHRGAVPELARLVARGSRRGILRLEARRQRLRPVSRRGWPRRPTDAWSDCVSSFAGGSATSRAGDRVRGASRRHRHPPRLARQGHLLGSHAGRPPRPRRRGRRLRLQHAQRQEHAGLPQDGLVEVGQGADCRSPRLAPRPSAGCGAPGPRPICGPSRSAPGSPPPRHSRDARTQFEQLLARRRAAGQARHRPHAGLPHAGGTGSSRCSYRAFRLGDSLSDGVIVFRARRRGGALEAAVCDVIAPPGARLGSAFRHIARQVGADYLLATASSAGPWRRVHPRRRSRPGADVEADQPHRASRPCRTSAWSSATSSCSDAHGFCGWPRVSARAAWSAFSRPMPGRGPRTVRVLRGLPRRAAALGDRRPRSARRHLHPASATAAASTPAGPENCAASSDATGSTSCTSTRRWWRRIARPGVALHAPPPGHRLHRAQLLGLLLAAHPGCQRRHLPARRRPARGVGGGGAIRRRPAQARTSRCSPTASTSSPSPRRRSSEKPSGPSWASDRTRSS